MKFSATRAIATLAAVASTALFISIAPPSARADDGFHEVTVDLTLPDGDPDGDGDGDAPLFSADVSLYTLRGGHMGSLSVGPLNEVPAGSYVLKVSAGPGYASTWYGDTPYRSQAKIIEITDHNVELPITIGWSGTLEGRVLTEAGTPVADGFAQAYLHDPSGGGYELAGWAVTDSTGAYSISAAPGSYVVKGSQHRINGGYSIPQLGDEVALGGEVVEVKEKQSTTGVDAVLKAPDVTTDRISGGDRFSTAVAASKAAFDPGVPVVYIANGLNWPDALSAGPAAAHRNAPLLLTTPMAIPPVLADELRRLRPEQIVVVGGPNSVSDVVLTQLDAFAPEVRRIGGANRYTVSQAVSADAFGSRMQSQQMLAATGNDFPDALSGGATAARLDAPIVLIDGHSSVIDDDTRWFLAYSSVDAVTAIGGPNSISPDMLDMLDHFTKWNSAGRYDGSDRFAVNRALNDDGGGSYPMPEWQQTAYLVNARNYPDALSATTLAGAEGARVYLAESTCVPRATLDLMRGSHIDHLVLVGGTASLSDAVARLTPC